MMCVNFRLVLVFIIGVSFSISSHSIGSKFIEILLSSDKQILSEALVSKKIDAKNMASIRNSINSLSAGSGIMSERQLKRIITNISSNLNPDEQVLLKSLKSSLDKDLESLDKKEIIAALDSLIFLAYKKGGSNAFKLSCSSCNAEHLATGFKYSFKEIKNIKIAKIFKEKIAHQNPKSLMRNIKKQMRQLKFGKYISSPDVIKSGEEKSLALFLELSRNGGLTHKELIETIKELSTKSNGEVQLLNEDNPHMFWRIFADDFTDEQLKGWNNILKETALIKKQEKIATKKAFYKALDKKAIGSSDLEKKVALLKRKDCFFK